MAGLAWLAGGAREGTVSAARAEAAPLPKRLSDTGLYLPGHVGEVDPRNLEFSPQYPLWSDGAVKRRWVRVPDGRHVDATDPDRWDFPAGTRFWKEFAFGRRVETRFIERLPDRSFRYATYVWNEAGTDAELAPASGVPGLVPTTNGAQHDVPAEIDCRACHEGRPNRILGFSALQLSSDRDPNAPHAERGGAGALTLEALVQRGVVRGLPLELVRRPPRIVADTATERAALGYLYGNCSGCHNAGGPLASLDLDFDQSVVRLAAGVDGSERVHATAVGHASRFSPPGTADAVRLAPGRPEESTVLFRMRARDALSQMPPLGTRVADADAVALVSRFVSEIRIGNHHKETPP
jgi:hypothetical protein